MWNLVASEQFSSNCYDFLVSSLLNYLGYDYYAYYSKYIYFDYYNPEEVDFSNHLDHHSRLNLNSSTNDLIILKEIYNIYVDFRRKESIEKLVNAVSNEIEKGPVGITIDPFYCHWSPFFNKVHYSHALLIVDIDYDNRQYFCYDLHFSTAGYAKVGFEDLEMHYDCMFVFYLDNAKTVNIDNMLRFIKNVLKYSDEETIRLNKKELFDYLTKNDRKKLFPDTFETSKILICLEQIAQDKMNSIHAFKYIEKKQGTINFSPIYGLLNKSNKNFLLLKMLLSRYALTGSINSNKVEEVIHNIFELDKEIIDIFQNSYETAAGVIE